VSEPLVSSRICEGVDVFSKQALRAGLAALFVLTLSACATSLPLGGFAADRSEATTPVVETAAPAPAPQPAAPQAEPVSPDRDSASLTRTQQDRLVYFEEARASQRFGQRGASDLDSRTMRLAFVDAPIVDAVRAIIEETLGQPVMVAAGVSGRITLTSAEPTSARTALMALETVLSESGYALVERETGYLLTVAGDTRPNLTGTTGQIGLGGRVVPVEHTDPSSILTLIDPFLSSRIEAVPQDEAGVLVLAGPASEVTAAEEAIRTFDRPFLTDRVFGMFELQFVNAQEAKTEVDAILSGMGISQTAVRTIALPRPNILFVASRDRERFNQVRDLIERFDTPSGGDQRRLRYYTARNAPATALASQITSAFAGGAAGDGGSFENSLASDRHGDDSALSDEPEGRLTIIPDQLNNALIIRATDQEYREILDLLNRMDVMPPQVLIEATIAEVRLIDGLNFGVRWFFESMSGDGTSNVGFTDDPDGTANATFPGFNYAFTGTDLTATLSALNSITDVTVLSAPSIMVQNNQTANLQVGDEVPIVTQTATSVADSNAPLVSSVELRETGVILEVTPRINASGVVVLEVNQEVSSVRPTTTSGIDSPTIQKLQFTSTVAVRSENTIALGGLIRETQSDNESGIPFLSTIPGLGNVFKDRQISSERSELVIFLTPRIINTDQDATDAMRRLSRELEALEERQPDLFE